MIEEKGVRSKRLDGEPKLGFPRVRMKLHVDGERLARGSRVDYSKIVTVEHKVKVFFIGTIHGDDYDIVVDAVNKGWERKLLPRKKHPPKAGGKRKGEAGARGQNAPEKTGDGGGVP